MRGCDVRSDAATTLCRNRLTEAYISDMERGLKVPSLTTILRLAVALGCRVSELVSIFDKVDDRPALLPK